MRLNWLLTPLLLTALRLPLFAQAVLSPDQMVREVVYNELHDHERHGYWRYWIERSTPQHNRVDDQIETPDGPLALQIRLNGHPLDRAARIAEQEKINRLLNSSAAQGRLRQDHADDERRIGRIVAMLPDAFLYEPLGTAGGLTRLRFRPNPAHAPRSMEERVFHAMRGELWIDTHAKRMARLEGVLQENVDFGYGLLGRLDRGGWFRLDRALAGGSDWKTTRLEVHMSGRALLFKTIARETSERRGGFVAVPAPLNLPQAAALLRSSEIPAPDSSQASMPRQP